MKDIFKPLSKNDLPDLGDALCRILGRNVVSPLDIGFMLGWVEAGIPREAVRRGLGRLRQRKLRSLRFPVNAAGEILEEYVVDAYEEMKEAHLGSP